MKGNCLIIGASHAGVNCAFALRQEGWEGGITIFDRDPHLPYHRPPLSKKLFEEEFNELSHALRPLESYDREKIHLALGKEVVAINKKERNILLKNGQKFEYSRLIIATGANAFLPPLVGLQKKGRPEKNIFPIRIKQVALNLKKALNQSINIILFIEAGFFGL